MSVINPKHNKHFVWWFALHFVRGARGKYNNVVCCRAWSANVRKIAPKLYATALRRAQDEAPKGQLKGIRQAGIEGC